MGYHGYAPGKYAPARPTEVQAALRLITKQDSFELLSKIVKNVAVNPGEDKYRRLRLSNVRIATAIVEVAGALDALLAMGWEQEEGDTEVLVCPKYAKMTMAEVRVIEDAKDQHKKELRRAPGKDSASKTALLDSQRREITKQLDADRRERQAQAPVTQGAVAQALPAGTNMVTAGEAGLATGGCC